MQICMEHMDEVDTEGDEPLSFDSPSSTNTALIETKYNSTSGSKFIAWPSSRLGSMSAKPHAPFKDPGWDAIRRVQTGPDGLGINDLNFVRRVGSGDIGSVYLVELKEAMGCLFAAKVMDKEELASRVKESRARVERQVLEMLDHPFLPTLYATMDSDRWSCLLTEFCPGGDLHVLRQRQPERRFSETAVRFYASEVVVALEYLHMKGIIYRDLKPENVLIRSDGHIMLTDFDLCLKCDDSSSFAQLINNHDLQTKNSSTSIVGLIKSFPFTRASHILPKCMTSNVSCFQPGRRPRRPSRLRDLCPEIVAEPIEARSMSFVGTHEYLSPEIVSGEGHGNAVDWWTLGIFIYEMFYGVTPFRGNDNECTLANIVARGVDFPKEPVVPNALKDLITQLLNKDPEKRMGSTIGATGIKHHPFFDGVNWALLRCTKPPSIPFPLDVGDDGLNNVVEYY